MKHENLDLHQVALQTHVLSNSIAFCLLKVNFIPQG